MPPENKTAPAASPAGSQRRKYQHYSAQDKANAQLLVSFFEAWGKNPPKKEIFEFCGISTTRGYEMLSKGPPKPTATDPWHVDRRGAHPKIDSAQLAEAEQLLETRDAEGQPLNWVMLKEAMEMSCSMGTVKKAVGSVNYHMCVACRRPWVSRQRAKERHDWARTALHKRPTPWDWDEVRFGDECGYAFGSERRLYVVRRPGEHLRSCCRSGDGEPLHELRGVHTWAAAGYNFKSELTFCDIHGHSRNGNMTQKEYNDHVLLGVVLPWLSRGDRFVLTEDIASGNGPTATRTSGRDEFKNRICLNYMYCCSSPDLSPVESLWHHPRLSPENVAPANIDSLKTRIVEEWNSIPQEEINRQVRSMPERLRRILEPGDPDPTSAVELL